MPPEFYIDENLAGRDHPPVHSGPGLHDSHRRRLVLGHLVRLLAGVLGSPPDEVSTEPISAAAPAKPTPVEPTSAAPGQAPPGSRPSIIGQPQ